jgi:archaellin
VAPAAAAEGIIGTGVVVVLIAMVAVVIVVPAMATQCAPFLRERSLSDGRDGSLSGLGIHGDPECSVRGIDE